MFDRHSIYKKMLFRYYQALSLSHAHFHLEDKYALFHCRLDHFRIENGSCCRENKLLVKLDCLSKVGAAVVPFRSDQLDEHYILLLFLFALNKFVYLLLWKRLVET